MDVRRVRTVGPVRITSKERPKTWNAETIIHYKVESWSRRGHVRKYKSGKVAYIKPMTCHRHGTGKDARKAPAPTTIKLRPDTRNGAIGETMEGR